MEDFVTMGEMIHEEARPDVTEMFVIPVLVKKAIPVPDEPIMKAALTVVELCVRQSVVDVP
jgi:hypothetical protein